MKTCTNCRSEKALEDFHRCAKARDGRASWCRVCANGIARAARKRNHTPEQKRRWQLKTRYGLTIDAYNAKLVEQDGVCAICRGEMKRPCVDHDHITGATRGILCHRCNIRLPVQEEPHWHAAATEYLEKYK